MQYFFLLQTIVSWNYRIIKNIVDNLHELSTHDLRSSWCLWQQVNVSIRVYTKWWQIELFISKICVPNSAFFLYNSIYLGWKTIKLISLDQNIYFFYRRKLEYISKKFIFLAKISKFQINLVKYVRSIIWTAQGIQYDARRNAGRYLSLCWRHKQ